MVDFKKKQGDDEDRVSKEEFGTPLDKLTPDDLDGDTAILTVTKAEKVQFDNGPGLRIAVEESEKPFVVSAKIDVDSLIERLGDRLSKWAGQKIPVEKTDRLYQGKKYLKVVPVPAGEWDELLSPKKAGRGKRR